MPPLQTLIYRLEVAGGTRYLRIALAAMTLAALLVGYNWRSYKNLSTQEGMDAAQLARNIAQGKGFSTSFVRPVSIFLLKRKAQRAPQVSVSSPAAGEAHLDRHPDLANAPVYPVLLAGLIRVLPFDFTITEHPSRFWKFNDQWARYQPDLFIALFNQVLLLALATLIFLLARRLFDTPVALLSALLLLGSELFWRFSVSGLSTLLLAVIFVALAWCLVRLEEEAREPRWGHAGFLVLAGLAGLLVGVGGLTRYSFAWLVIPVVGFVVAVSGRRRLVAGLLSAAMFAAVLAPWVTRNYAVCGQPFGTATFAVLETSYPFPEHSLERSLEPDLSRWSPAGVRLKAITNLRGILSTDLPRLGGSWVSGFGLVGLLLNFQRPGLRRLRYFLLGSLLVLVAVQAFGRTQLSEDSPEINSENLLVLVAPLVLVYGVSLFFSLLENVRQPFPGFHHAATGLFGVVACLPLLLTFLLPPTSPMAYPPYYPPWIQRACNWTHPEELIMSDVPWAVAWYGQSQSLWLTPNTQSDFVAIDKDLKPIRALYLTSVTLDARFLSQWVGSDDQNWWRFLLNCEKKGRPPEGFPLQHWQPDFRPYQFLLTFREQPPPEP